MGLPVIPGDASLIKWLICLLALAEGPRPTGCLPTSTSRLNNYDGIKVALNDRIVVF